LPRGHGGSAKQRGKGEEGERERESEAEKLLGEVLANLIHVVW
jgi:hypothetical protein